MKLFLTKYLTIVCILFGNNLCFPQENLNSNFEFCLNITNLDQFKDVIFVLVKQRENNFLNYIIAPTICTDISFPQDKLKLIAAASSDLNNKKLDDINLLNSSIFLKSEINLTDQINNDGNYNIIVKIQIDIQIIGFTSDEVLIKKQKETIFYEDGEIKSISDYEPIIFSLDFSNHFPHNISYLTNTSIKVFPNPANSEMNITIDNDFIGEYYLHITTIDGQVIYTSKLLKEKMKPVLDIDISNLKSGLYFLIFKFNETKVTKKFMVL